MNQIVNSIPHRLRWEENQTATMTKMREQVLLVTKRDTDHN